MHPAPGSWAWRVSETTRLWQGLDWGHVGPAVQGLGDSLCSAEAAGGEPCPPRPSGLLSLCVPPSSCLPLPPCLQTRPLLFALGQGWEGVEDGGA